MTVKESRTASLFETNVKTSVDEFLLYPKMQRFNSLRRGWEKNVTQPKGDNSIQVENRSNNLKKHVVTPTFYAIK